MALHGHNRNRRLKIRALKAKARGVVRARAKRGKK